MKILLILAVLIAVVSCTQVNRAKREIANGVDSYCNSMTLAERQQLRAEVNAALAEKGNSIKVTCKGDPDS
jgi:hypothetical protein